jgi:flagellar biogenesis protein FliO
MSDNFENNIDLSNDPTSSTPNNKPFVITISVLSIILVLGLAVMAVWVWGQAQGVEGSGLALFDFSADDSVNSTATADALAAVQGAEAQPTSTLFPSPTAGAALPAAEEGTAPEVEDVPAAESESAAAEGETAIEESSEDSAVTPELPQDVLPDAARTATVKALLTAAAESQSTPESTATELPDTGFVDEVGLPLLGALAMILVLVIILVRRLRTVSSA